MERSVMSPVLNAMGYDHTATGDASHENNGGCIHFCKIRQFGKGGNLIAKTRWM